MIRPAVGVKAEVEYESGRWTVYLDVSFWRKSEIEDPRRPIEVVRKRIRDYSTKQEADVAAHWIERTADRDKAHRNLGF